MYMIFGIAFKVYKLLCALIIFQLFLFFSLLLGSPACIAGRFFTNWAIREAPLFYNISLYLYLAHVIVTFNNNMAFHCTNNPIEWNKLSRIP